MSERAGANYVCRGGTPSCCGVCGIRFWGMRCGKGGLQVCARWVPKPLTQARFRSTPTRPVEHLTYHAFWHGAGQALGAAVARILAGTENRMLLLPGMSTRCAATTFSSLFSSCSSTATIRWSVPSAPPCTGALPSRGWTAAGRRRTRRRRRERSGRRRGGICAAPCSWFPPRPRSREAVP